MTHDLAFEHPYRLSDAPLEVLAARFEDALDTADATPLFEAWQAIPKPREGQ